MFKTPKDQRGEHSETAAGLQRHDNREQAITQTMSPLLSKNGPRN